MFLTPKYGQPPWFSTHASIGTQLAEVVPPANPCAPCSAPCCWYLLLEKDTIEGQEDLDAIEEYMRYESMLAWIGDDAEYAIGFITPCSKLDRTDYRCTLFEQPTRPRVCVEFSPEPCWYRWHQSSSPREVCRLDASRWAAFRDRIQKAPGPLPDPTELQGEDVVFNVLATLAFDIPADTVAPEARDDLLYFFSCFENASVARTNDDWYLLLTANRRADRPPATFECKPDHVAESAGSESFILVEDDVLRLAGSPDVELFECSVSELRMLVGEVSA